MSKIFNALMGLAIGEFDAKMLCSMALDATAFDPTGSGSKGILKSGFYKTSTDSLATVLASGYFNTFASTIKTGDLIYISASNGDVLAKMTSSAGVVTSQVVQSFGGLSTSTSTASTLSPVGTSRITIAGAKTVALGPPFNGAVKRIVKDTTSTGILTVNVGAGVTLHGSNTNILMNGQNGSVTLVGVSTTKWAVVEQNSVTFS